ncbi:trypsin-like peptidase domain-containing protein [Streptomyces sp. NPDC059071]|uniref:nSTAND1 domain-containing NTPase n=1 Tax=unclassified Streptomyces TaxID=2593676 RepID=UPI003657CFF8
MAAVYEEEILARSVVRVRSRSGHVVGAGFLVAADLVATCAHVVARADGQAGIPDEPPDGPVDLDLPLLGGRTARATVVTWRLDDIALLRLDRPVPGSRPVPLADGGGTQVWGHPFRVLGFPDHDDGGVWATGTLLGGQGAGWIQMETHVPGPRIVPGFSGAPVWDEEQGGVVGMTVAADGAEDSTTAYLIPSADLVDGAALPARCPFRGLAPFTEADAALFHGREDETARLRAAVARRPLTLVVGPSGCGKSSLVRAGLLPALRADGATVTELRAVPGTPPAAALAHALVALLEPEAGEVARLAAAEELARLLEHAHTPAALRERLLRRSGPGGHVLFVDQLEEYAAADPAAARTLVGLLVALCGGSSRVVATARPESLDALLTSDAADVLSDATRYLAPLSADALLRAVTGPVAAVPGLWFEPGLPERIVADAAGEPGRMPLVEFALTRLWERRAAATLTHAAYDALGGVAGALVGYAEECVEDRLRPGEEPLARRLFAQLARPADDGRFARRPARTADLDPALAALARRLAPTKLLVLGDAGGEEIVDLAHESLTVLWPRLRDWLAETRDFRAWQEQLRRDLARWEEQDREPDALLRGSVLATAADWLARRPEDLTDAERAYIRAGDHQARRGTRRLRVTVAVFAVLAVLAGTLSVVAWRSINSVQKQLRVQAAQVLAEVSRRHAANMPATALQLALAARATDPAPETYGPLLRQYARGQYLTGSHAGLWPGAFQSMDATPDGRTAVVLSLDEDGRRRLSVVTGLDGEHPGSRPLNRVPAEALEDAGRDGASELSPDGATFALASGDGRVWLWDLTEDGPDAWPRTLPSDDARGRKVNGVDMDFSGDGRLLLRMLSFYDETGSTGPHDRRGALSAWEVHSGRPLPTAPGLVTEPTRYVTFTADPGRVLVVPEQGAGNLRVGVRELATGREVRTFDATYSTGMPAAGGDLLVVESSDAVSRTSPAHAFPTSGPPGPAVPLPAEVTPLNTPDRTGEFAVVVPEGTAKPDWYDLQLVHVRTGRLYRTRIPRTGLPGVTDSPQGVLAAFPGPEGGLAVLVPTRDTLLTARAVPVAALPRVGALRELVNGGLSPDGTRLARSGEDFLEMVHTGTGHAERVPQHPDSYQTPVFWTADSRWAVVVQPDGGLSAFSADDPRRRVDFDMGAWARETQSKDVEAIEPMRGSELAVLTSDGRLTLFDAATGRGLARPVRVERRTPAQLTGFNPATGQLRARPGHPDQVAVVTRTMRDNGTVELWNLRAGTRLRTFPTGALPYAFGPDPSPYLVFDPAGRTLLTSHDDGFLRRWDAEKGTPARPPLALGDEGARLVGLGPGELLVTVDPVTGDTRFWDLGTGRLLTDLPLAAPLGVRIQGTRLLAAGDGWFLDLDLRPGEMTKALCAGALARDFTAAERDLLPPGAPRNPPCRTVGG